MNRISLATSLHTEEFLEKARQHPVLDVRTPAEYEHGHIPGAENLPLFSNEERAIIGTLYKQKGREQAVLKGLELVGPKLRAMVEFAGERDKSKTFLVHCWRGGMRSASVAGLLEFYGYKVYTLKGGYKFFRRWVLEQFGKERKLVILGGRTGSGKTEILREMQRQGEQVLDLEKLAQHKGSSFGSLGEDQQPSQEEFENRLAMALAQADPSKQLWAEDESRLIGNKVIPDAFWEKMRDAGVVYMDVPGEERIRYLTEEYGKYSLEEIRAALERIGKRLGGQHLKTALEALEQKDARKVCETCLVYYDKTYDYGIGQRSPEMVKRVVIEKMNWKSNAEQIRTAMNVITEIK